MNFAIRAFSVLAIMGLVSCSSAPKKDIEPAIPTAVNADENLMGDSDSGRAFGLQTVHFPFDSFTLESEAKATLKSNAEILKNNPNLRIQIEGHCDNRGGIQYNIALGERRANATKKYLIDLDIVGDRMTIISLGKEKPIDPEFNEEAYARNRRSNFVVTSK
jgi:peptidoglycan-associated lipoprotein